MTRETKIGLLVGLAFIIVIGILLSDHLTSTTEPAQAPLAQVARDVRTGVAVPGGATAPVTQVQVPQQVAPQTPVATREELTPKPQPVAVVQIGPANTPPAPPAQPLVQQTRPVQAPAPEQVASNPPAAPVNPPSTHTANPELQRIADNLHEPIVQVDPQPNNVPPQTPARNSAGREYKAEAGDSVSKMAARFLGSNTKTNRELIINANASLKQDANKVIVGKTYVIPTQATVQAQATAPVAAPVAPAPTPTATPVPSTSEHLYTVKSGDTLTKIALEQIGTADAISAILELNKDRIKDANSIHPNMKLRMPAKPISVAQSQ